MSILLAGSQSLAKRANIGGDPEGNFEQSFASLGYNFLSEKAPRLLEHMLGFQLLDRNDDMSRAVGVYGFQADTKRLYMPLFFLNGELRGQELLFVQNKDEGQFVPMKENWVNFLLSKSPHIMGEASQKDVFQMGGMWPDLRPFTNAYRGSKYSCDMPRIQEWAKPFMPVYARLCTTNPLRDTRYAKIATAQNLLSESPMAVKMAIDLCDRFPNVKAAMHRCYGADVFEKALLTIKARLTKEASDRGSILSFKPQKVAVARSRSSILPDLTPQDPVKLGALKIMRVDPNERFTHNIPDRSREEATGDTRRGAVVITDKRLPQDKSTLYNTAIHTAYTNPTRSSLAEVLAGAGKFEKCLIIHRPYSGKGQHTFVTVVRAEGQSSARNWINSDATNIYVRQPIESQFDFKTWFDGLSSAKMTKDSTYVALTGDGRGTLPFTVNSVLDDDCYRVQYETGHKRPQYAHMSRNYSTNGLGDRDTPPNPSGYTDYNALLHLNGRKGSSIHAVGGELWIPDSAKILKIQDPFDPEDDSDEDSISPLQPGNLIDVQNQIYQKTASLKLWTVGSDEIALSTKFGTRRMSKQAAYVAMVADLGLGIDDADAAMDKVTKAGSAKFRILYGPFYQKRADAWPGYGGDLLDQGPSAPREGPPPTGSGFPWYGGAINKYPQEEYLEVPGLNAYSTNPWIYDPTRIPDPGTGPGAYGTDQAGSGSFSQGQDSSSQGVQNAAASGQKEVFDTTILSNLLNSVRQESVVDRYLSDLMTGLDRIGRILFSFYWHMDDVKEHYGAAETPDLIDAMRNAFEECGDVTLKLRQNSMNPDMGEMGSPNVEDVARAD
jgi:hypothetical protein